MGRAPCCDKASVRKGPWSDEEDNILRNYMEENGNGRNWILLPRKAGLNRCGKSCRLRWMNYLRPNIKHGGFTDEEDDIICTLYSNIGSKWSLIASRLPGRTDNDVKNYWNAKLKKKLLGNPKLQTKRRNPTTNEISIIDRKFQSSELESSVSENQITNSLSEANQASSKSSYFGLLTNISWLHESYNSYPLSEIENNGSENSVSSSSSSSSTTSLLEENFSICKSSSFDTEIQENFTVIPSSETSQTSFFNLFDSSYSPPLTDYSWIRESYISYPSADIEKKIVLDTLSLPQATSKESNELGHSSPSSSSSCLSSSSEENSLLIDKDSEFKELQRNLSFISSYEFLNHPNFEEIEGSILSPTQFPLLWSHFDYTATDLRQELPF